ncbi:MAG: Maf family protein [Candidatus Binataceae bacterium]
MNDTELILASGSPRRSMLLARVGISFRVIVSGIDEVRGNHERADNYALRLAREKALSVSKSNPAAVVLAADTVVVCEGEILEKPRDAEDAKRMLRMLSDRVHAVVTAYAIARAGTMLESAPVLSRVRFRRLDEAEIQGYIATRAPFDKAGAYGIQDAGAGFILEVCGSRDNVMGLPINEVTAALARQGIFPVNGR